MGAKYRTLFKHFKLNKHQIYYNGEIYPLSLVKHIARKRTGLSINFIPISRVLTIEIHLENRARPISLRNSGLPFTMRKLEKLYRSLSEATFASRVQPLMNQFDNEQFFNFADAKFTQQGDVIKNGKSISLHRAKLRVTDRHLLIYDRSRWFGYRHKLDIRQDSDLLFWLLNRQYGISVK